MIRACNPTVVGKAGVFALYIAEGPKASDYRQGQLISVRSGLNARAGAATYQSSRSVGQRVPIGTRANPQNHYSNLIMLSTTGHRRMDFVRVVPVRERKQPATLLWLRDQSPNGH
jgi:hypothetical protein